MLQIVELRDNAVSYLGSVEKLSRLTVLYYWVQGRVQVWVKLLGSSFDGQLEAVRKFNSVRELYRDDVLLELKFGLPGSFSERDDVEISTWLR